MKNTIYIVDDDEINNFICEKVIKSTLPDVGIKCFTNSVKALSMFLESDVDSHTSILLDLNMPEMDGWEFLKKFKEKKGKCNLYILSTSLNPDDIEEAEKDPYIKGYISKPLTKENIEMFFSTQN